MGDPQGKWDFFLSEEMGLAAEQPHCQCRKEGDVVDIGEVAPSPTCQMEMGAQPLFVLCV